MSLTLPIELLARFQLHVRRNSTSDGCLGFDMKPAVQGVPPGWVSGCGIHINFEPTVDDGGLGLKVFTSYAPTSSVPDEADNKADASQVINASYFMDPARTEDIVSCSSSSPASISPGQHGSPFFDAPTGPRLTPSSPVDVGIPASSIASFIPTPAYGQFNAPPPSEYNNPSLPSGAVESYFDGIDQDIIGMLSSCGSAGIPFAAAVNSHQQQYCADLSDSPLEHFIGDSSRSVNYHLSIPESTMTFHPPLAMDSRLPTPTESLPPSPPATITELSPSSCSSPTGYEGESDSIAPGQPTSGKGSGTQRLKRFRCLNAECDRLFTSEYTRRVHMAAHDPKPRLILPCTMGCSEMFSRRHDRLRHEVVQHGRACEHLCKECNHFFSSSKMLQIHKCRGKVRGKSRWTVPDHARRQ